MHLQFISFTLSLIDKARDGQLTISEVGDCMTAFAPDLCADVVDAVEAAMEDGEISVMDVINIASSVIA